MSKTSDLLAKLKARLQDSDGAIFPESYLIAELNSAQYELLSMIAPEYIDDLLVADKVVFDLSGEYNLSDLTKTPLKSKLGIIKLSLYDKYTGVRIPVRDVNFVQLNKILSNSLYEGTKSSPVFIISSGKMHLYAKDSTGVLVKGVFYSINEFIIDDSEIYPLGPIFGNSSDYDDYYIGCTLVSGEESSVVVSYLGSINKLAIPDDFTMSGQTEANLRAPNDIYLGLVEVLYYREPAVLNYATTPTPIDIDCELSESLIQPLLLLAESSIWDADGKDARGERKYQRALAIIQALNQTIKSPDNVGYRAKKE